MANGENNDWYKRLPSLTTLALVVGQAIALIVWGAKLSERVENIKETHALLLVGAAKIGGLERDIRSLERAVFHSGGFSQKLSKP